MSDQRILEKLGNLEKQSNKLDQKVDKIEITVGLIAVQSERINNMHGQIQTLWKKHDEAFGSDGEVIKIKQFQSSCPRDLIKANLNRQWWSIGLLATIVAGCLVKIVTQ